MSGFVYFVSSGLAVKIGYSVDPTQRFAALQTSHPAKLTLLGRIPGTRELERDLDDRFAKYRRVGEWFTADDALVDAIEGLLANPPPIPPKRVRVRARSADEALVQRIHAYFRQRHPHDTAAAVAEAIGVSVQTTAKWFGRDSLPNAEGIARCLYAYGPTFLAAMLDPTADWVVELIRLERRGEIIADLRALMRELRDLDRALGDPPATGPPVAGGPVEGETSTQDDGP